MDFEEAQTRVKKLARTPDNTELLELYSLYKQGTSGDVTGKRPGMLDLRGRAKFDAWSGQRGKTRDEAQSQYVALVTKLEQKYGTS